MAEGFDRVGTCSPGPFEHSEFFQAWLDRGYHGEMGYLERDPGRRMDATQVRDWTQSIIVVALNSHTAAPQSADLMDDPERGWISRYAWGDDYHVVMEKMLKHSADLLSQETGGQFRYYVDHGPVLEKLAGRAGGLGWIGKNTLLIHPKAGSWFFLGAILTDLELTPDVPLLDHCGTCTRCLDVCPTDAFPSPYVLDATKCISYLTIEHRGEVQETLSGQIGSHVFGCDLCQDVCPWNRKAPVTTREEFQAREGSVGPRLEEWAALSPEEFQVKARRSPMKRKKYSGVMENLERAMANKGSRDVSETD